MRKRLRRFHRVEGPKEPVCQVLEETGNHPNGVDIIDYFKSFSKESGIPYQNLINGTTSYVFSKASIMLAVC